VWRGLVLLLTVEEGGIDKHSERRLSDRGIAEYPCHVDGLISTSHLSLGSRDSAKLFKW
jgi:hypothetical protein